MRFSTTKAFAALAATGLCALGLAACGGSSDSSSGTAQAFDPNKDVTITVWQPFTPGERESGSSTAWSQTSRRSTPMSM